MTTTRQIISPVACTIFGAMNTSATNSDVLFGVPASKTVNVLAKFAPPRSPLTNAGSTLNNVILNFTNVSGVLASVTPVLTRTQYQHNVAPVVTTVAITPGAFTLTAGAINRVAVAINVPAIDNQATTLSIAYSIVVTFVAAAGADVQVQLANMELDYTYAATGAVLNGSVAAGSTLAAIAAGSRTNSNKAGSLLFTNVSTIAAGATDTLTIVNTAAGTHGIVTLEAVTTAATSAPYITAVVWTQGVSIAVTIQNGGAGATGAAGAFTFRFMSFN